MGQLGRVTLILTLRRIKVTIKRRASTANMPTMPAVTFAPRRTKPDGSVLEKWLTAWPWLPRAKSSGGGRRSRRERDGPRQHAG
jgi:hypothetical protein